MPKVAEIMFGLFAASLILFLACCLFVIAEHEYKEWREHRKGKR